MGIKKRGVGEEVTFHNWVIEERLVIIIIIIYRTSRRSIIRSHKSDLPRERTLVTFLDYSGLAIENCGSGCAKLFFCSC